MDSKDSTFYPLIALFFILGLVIGYAIHKPETVQKIQYIDRPVENIVEVTTTPLSTPPASTAAATATPAPDFTIRNYDPSIDKPTMTIELVNWRANPEVVTIRVGETVLIKISDYTVQSPITFILNSSYKENLGKSGARMITFNKKGTYDFKAVIPSSDPSILPAVYAEKGTIIVRYE
ncbi:MAG: hypothetical protein O8C60_02825 [Candidatus Methanoperedens sp.]|nr:hypothetical protein [Candidatus Methanoperedens sp.]